MLALAATCTAGIATAAVVAIDIEIAVAGSIASAEKGRIAEVAVIDGRFGAVAAVD
jgi:hypothetical protein